MGRPLVKANVVVMLAEVSLAEDARELLAERLHGAAVPECVLQQVVLVSVAWLRTAIDSA